MRFKDFVTEAPKAPKPPLPEGIKLIQLLMVEIHGGDGGNYKLKLQPTQQQEALDEAVRIMRRVMAGADGPLIKGILWQISNDLKVLRKSLLPFPTHESHMDEAGVWIENKEVARTLQIVAGIQQEVVKSHVYMENLYELLFVLEYVYRLIEGQPVGNGNGSLDAAGLTFAKATFKKLGIL
jgi:hypothetical protein